jgi:aldose 1-epimerase
MLRIYADCITPINEQSIPFGNYLEVKGTAYDFHEPKRIGQDIDADDDQIRTAHGYDQNFVVADGKGELKKVAEAWSEDNGVTLEVETDLPGVQFYSGNFIQKQTGRGGSSYAPRTGFALETQFAPNALNTETFARPFIKARETFKSTTVYRLGINTHHKK